MTVANFLLSLTVKVENRLTFGEVMDRSTMSCFLTHSVEVDGKPARMHARTKDGQLENITPPVPCIGWAEA